MQARCMFHCWALLFSLSLCGAFGKLIHGGHYDSPVPTSATAAADRCDFSVELMFIADASASQSDKFAALSVFFGRLAKSLMSKFPGSKVGFGTFVDKPSSPSDQTYCYKTRAAIGTTPPEFSAIVSKVPVGGGSDQPENVLGAMMRAAMSPWTGWSEGSLQSGTELPIVKVLVASTDAMPHSSDYFSRAKQATDSKDYSGIPKKLGRFVDEVTPSKLKEDENSNCFETEYPSYDDWATSMKKYNILPYFLVGNWTYEAEGRLYFPLEYLRYSIESDRPEWSSTESGLQAFFTDLLIEQNLDGLVDSLQDDFSDLDHVVYEGLVENLIDLVC